MKILFSGKDAAGEFYRASFAELFRYITYRIPEISDDIQRIDEAVCAGFGWETGPFAIWDILGVQNVVTVMEKWECRRLPRFMRCLKRSFFLYEYKDGAQQFYDLGQGARRSKSGASPIILLDACRKKPFGKTADVPLSILAMVCSIWSFIPK